MSLLIHAHMIRGETAPRVLRRWKNAAGILSDSDNVAQFNRQLYDVDNFFRSGSDRAEAAEQVHMTGPEISDAEREFVPGLSG